MNETLDISNGIGMKIFAFVQTTASDRRNYRHLSFFHLSSHRMAKLAPGALSIRLIHYCVLGHFTRHQKFRQSVVFPRPLPVCHYICVVLARRHIGGRLERYHVLSDTTMARIIESKGMHTRILHMLDTKSKIGIFIYFFPKIV